MDHHQQNEEPQKNDELKGFVPPRHWIGPEELDASYWQNPQVQEKRGQEFFEKPLEWMDQKLKSDQTGLARREFLTLMGASIAMASLSCTRRPVHKIIPYVVKPEQMTLGVPSWYASTCQECSTGCGVLVKTREGRPIKLEGNPDHPLNQGALCARGQASVLNLYDLDRLKAPVIRSRKEHTQNEVSWSEVDANLVKQFKGLASGLGRVRVLTSGIRSESTQRLIDDFLNSFRDGKRVDFEPLALTEIAESQELSYGNALTPLYRFDQANLILSLGADFLGNWVSPVEHAQAWSKRRKLQGQKPAQAQLSKLICFEPTLTLTGSNADERYPVRPGDELKIALGLAHLLILKQKRSVELANDPFVISLLSQYPLERVALELGLDHGLSEGGSLLFRIAVDLWNNRGKSLVVSGSLPSKTQDSLALQVITNLLNSVLGNEGSTVDGMLGYTPSHSRFAEFSQLIQEMKDGKVDALILYRTNPLYSLAGAFPGLAEIFQKVPLIISVSDRVDETGLVSDYVLPDHHYLENWGDSNPRKKVYSLQQPTIAPIHSTRAFQDSLLVWMKQGQFKQSTMVSNAGDWHEYLKNHWKETYYKEAGSSGSFEQFWEATLRAGVLNLASSQGNLGALPGSRSFKTDSLKKLMISGGLNSKDVSLALYAKISMYDGRSANNPWLQEMPDPISTVTWDNYLNISPALAKTLGVKGDDVVELRAGEVKAELPVYIQPGLHSQVVSVALGYGRQSVGKIGNQAGINVFPFIQSKGQHLVFSGQPVQIRKTGKFYKLAATQWHGATENRPIINDIILSQYRKNPSAEKHTDPHLRLEAVPSIWPAHEYKSYRWGMAIDLNSCTGCGACVIACQAENNVPVVGREQVRVSRQMHWLRIDRYYSGSPAHPDVVFQPMLCQHCENAPCETVCPVLATVHDDEGLNVQIYNRCVGTRYCQNNCPYKVRRFNFFDHWKSYEGTMSLAWNPDVTVRTRGIMEKCTFCVQRIRDAKDKAKDAGEKVKDGQFKTACQQTCPTEAIVFGDMNDPNSRVFRLKESPQAFRVLEVLNAKPSISYMTKVRNKGD